MNSTEFRERIAQFADYRIFISLTDEVGDGPVVAVKDLIDVRGTVTTGGGIILPNEPAENDAPVVRRLREAGGCVIGKANLHEWATGVTNENPHYGTVLNPRDPARVAGGSSGGSAAAVAAGLCDWAIGTDTGGSIRIPASLCGVVGFKPTVGTVSTEGVIPLSWSLDTVGPLAPDVRSAARALEIMSGLTDLVPPEETEFREFKIAVPTGWATGLDHETQVAWDWIRRDLSEISFPDRDRIEALYQPIFLVEAAAFHQDWMAAYPERYGADVLAIMRRGSQELGVGYVRAVRQRPSVLAEMEEAMGDCDAILLPASACVAPPLGAKDVREWLLRFTRPFSYSGQPIITMPAPVSGLPVGIQVVGHSGKEAELCRVARAIERHWQHMWAVG